MAESNKKSEVEKIDFTKDISTQEVQSDILHKERLSRYIAEVKIYFIIKELITTLNQYVASPLLTLKIIASGYRKTHTNFDIVTYSADQ